MMERFETQILRAAIAEMGSELQGRVGDPSAQAKLVMTRFLLAHALGQQEVARDWDSVADEVAALRKAEQDEQALLNAAPAVLHETPLNAETLTVYLREKLKMPKLHVSDVQASLGGFSKQTWLLKLSGADPFGNALVLRRDQEGGPVEVRAADEYAVIKLMHTRGVAVPEPLFADRAPPFGGTLLVMRRIAGQPAFDVTGQHLGPEGRNAALALARVLAQIHAAPVEALGLPADIAQLPLREHVHRQVQLYDAQWQRRRISNSPTLRAAFDWLYANIPSGSSGPALVHGDASLRNLLVHDGHESAMLDWELWHVGDASEDLAYARPDVEQALSWDEFLREYHAHGGRPFDAASSDYYGVFGAVRNAVFAQSCLHDLVSARQPEAKFAYGALVLGRRLIYNLAERFGG